MTGFSVEIDGRPVAARPGDTLAVVLLRAGIVAAGQVSGRGLFCGMGSCYECHAVVDGVPFTRTCMTSAHPGMRVWTRDPGGQA
jgi:D-hydroxyproline dehydrogenase subunit gamma